MQPPGAAHQSCDPMANNPQPCHDCVNFHGDKPEEWLNKWPAGAEFCKQFGVYLCDGCLEDRVDDLVAEDYWRDGVFDDPMYCY